jgi:exonuclease SbcC
MTRILHAADFHVDDKNIDEAKKCLEFLVETVKIITPDITIIAGDLFESRSVRLESMATELLFEVISKIADLSPVSIVFGTASHEGEATAALRYIKAKYPVHVSMIPEQYYMMHDDSFVDNPSDSQPKLVISAVPQPTKKYFSSSGSIDSTNQEIAGVMSGVFGGLGAKASQYTAPHILIGHFSVSGAFLSATRQMIGFDVEISSDQIALANADLVALGHIHLKQQIQKNIFYSGSLFQSDTSEAGQDFGFWIHELDDAHRLQKSEYIITPFTRLYKLTHDFTDTQDTFKVPFTQENLDQIKGAVVKVEITAYEDDVAKIDRDDLERNLAEAKSFEIKIIRSPRENVRSEKLLKLTTLREKLTEMAKLRGEDVPESILSKADNLESMEADEIVSMAGK